MPVSEEEKLPAETCSAIGIGSPARVRGRRSKGWAISVPDAEGTEPRDEYPRKNSKYPRSGLPGKAAKPTVTGPTPVRSFLEFSAGLPSNEPRYMSPTGVGFCRT